MDKNIRTQGLKRILEGLQISEGDIEFAGRMETLENDQEVKSVGYVAYNPRRCDVYLKESRGITEILAIASRTNFDRKFTYKSKKQLNFEEGGHEYTLRFHQPDEQ